MLVVLASLSLLGISNNHAVEPSYEQDVLHSYCTAFLENPRNDEPTGYYSQIFPLPPGAQRNWNVATEFNIRAFAEVVGQTAGVESTSFQVGCSPGSRSELVESLVDAVALDRSVQITTVNLQFEPFTDQDAAPAVDLVLGSLENPLLLNCSTSGGQNFFSLSDVFENSPVAVIKVAGPVVSVWRAASRQWVEHPCVKDSRDGQYCIVTPAALNLQASYELSPGALDVSTLQIDRSTGAFRFQNVLATPGIAPYMQSKSASGTCNATSDPGGR